jgi:hypothetical protein
MTYFCGASCVSSATIHDCGVDGVANNYRELSGRGIHDGLVSISIPSCPLSHIVFSIKPSTAFHNKQPSPKVLHLQSTFIQAFQLQSHTLPSSSPIQPHSNTMASAMYRPSFTRSTSPSNASISSKSSTSSSVRAVYTRDGQGWELSTSYPSGIETKALAPPPAFNRAEYSRDARGVDIDFSSSYKFSKQQTTSAPTPFKGCAYAKDGKGIDFSSSYRGRQ